MMIQAKLKLPELQTKKLWVGLYGGHYDVIVFFKEKPVKNEDGIYDCYDNREKISGAMWPDIFYKIFPEADISQYTQEDGRPLDIHILDVFEIELTWMFDENGIMESIGCHEDGW